MKSRKEQLEIELAFENGAEIEYSDPTINTNWKVIFYPNWQWKLFDYRIKEEPKRIPFDGSDAFNLRLQTFKHIEDTEDETDYLVCVLANYKGVMLADKLIRYDELAKYWLKWNTLTEKFEPCNKIA